MAFSPDGKWIVSGGHEYNKLKVWDASTGRDIRTLKGHGGSVICVAFSPNGKRIVSGHGSGNLGDCIVKVWDAMGRFDGSENSHDAT